MQPPITDLPMQPLGFLSVSRAAAGASEDVGARRQAVENAGQDLVLLCRGDHITMAGAENVRLKTWKRTRLLAQYAIFLMEECSLTEMDALGHVSHSRNGSKNEDHNTQPFFGRAQR